MRETGKWISKCVHPSVCASRRAELGGHAAELRGQFDPFSIKPPTPAAPRWQAE